MSKWYGVEDVVRMSGLSERTVRNYLSMGLLEGEKVDGAWRFTAEQFEAFLRQEMVSQSVRAKANSIVYDFLLVEKRREGAACLILDLPAAAGAAEAALRQRVVDGSNARGLRCSYRYQAASGCARVILEGSPAQAASLVGELSQTN